MSISIVKKENLEQHYVVSSNKMYTIGAQDGTFPELGFHVPGQMGGVMSQPIKLLDGYSASLVRNGEEILLENAQSFVLKENEVEFVYDIEGIKIYRSEICYHAMRVLEISWRIESEEDVDLKISYKSHVVGCWTREMVGKDCTITILEEKQSDGIILRNKEEHWFLGIFLKSCNGEYEVEQKSDMPKVQMYIKQANRKDEIICHVVGSIESKEEIQKVYKEVKDYHQHYRNIKRERLQSIKNTCQIVTNIEKLDKAYDYLKIDYDALVQDIEGIGEGYTAGYPDYPWFFGCDSCFGIKGTTATGQHAMSMNTLRLLKDVSVKANEGNGRIIHELSPFNIVYNPGNTVETPQFVSAVYEVFEWTGDMTFLEEMYPVCEKGIGWVRENYLETKTCLPLGAGMVEVEGLNTRMIDTAVYMYCGYRDLGNMAKIMGHSKKAESYLKWAEELKEGIVKYFYMPEENLFADALCTKQELEERKEEIIHATKNTQSQVAYLSNYLSGLLQQQGEEEFIQVLIKNWVIILPLIEEILPDELAKEMVKVLLEKGFLNEYGMMLSGMPYDKNEQSDDIYAMYLAMSINTGCLAKACIKYGFVDEGFELIMKMCNTLGEGMPGTIAEVLPDKGCFMQLWSGYSVHHVLIQDILGIRVDAYHKEISIQPCFPKELSHVTMKRFKIGAEWFDIEFDKDIQNNIRVRISGDIDKYTIKCQSDSVKLYTLMYND